MQTVKTLVVLGVMAIAPVAARAADDMQNDATTVRKHKEAMDKGMSHQDASMAAEGSKAGGEAATSKAKAKRHKEAMDKGMSHQDASKAAE